MVDVKPDNIRVNSRSLQIALLDVDSYRITGDGTVYPGTHWSPGYILPSALNVCDTASVIASLGEDQDRYCLAVLIFEFLNYGIYPFQGISLTNDNEDNSQDGNARHYRYAYGIEPSPYIKPTPGSVHECWPVGLRQMFDRAFSPDGSVSPAEWYEYFASFIGKLEKCAKQTDNARHIRFEDCHCMACTRAQAIADLKPPPPRPPPIDPTVKPSPGPTTFVSPPPVSSPAGSGNPGAYFGWIALWILYAAVSHWYYGTPWNDLWPIKFLAGSPPPARLPSSLTFPMTEPRFSDPNNSFLSPNNPFQTKPSNSPRGFGTGN